MRKSAVSHTCKPLTRSAAFAYLRRVIAVYKAHPAVWLGDRRADPAMPGRCDLFAGAVALLMSDRGKRVTRHELANGFAILSELQEFEWALATDLTAGATGPTIGFLLARQNYLAKDGRDAARRLEAMLDFITRPSPDRPARFNIVNKPDVINMRALLAEVEVCR